LFNNTSPMSATFDIFSVKSVPSTYSWDRGTPNVSFGEFLTELSACSANSNNEGGVEYIGYAPFMFVSLSSSPGQVSNSFLALRRKADFGDYYNSSSNIVTVPTLSNELFCHSYVMPGLYSVRLERTEYIQAKVKPLTLYGDCLQKHCIDWSWKTLATCTQELSVTWASTLTASSYEKKWKFEPCEATWAVNNGVYDQNTAEPEKHPLSWQWYNFLCNPKFNNPNNTKTLWISSGFQQPEQLTWKESVGPCIDLGYGPKVPLVWDRIRCQETEEQYTSALTWDETKTQEASNITWDAAREECEKTDTYTVSAQVQTIVKEALIRVIEIPPTAYLKVFQPEDRTSPLTVTLSPRNIICGSFPIEKIVWDLGDGSPQLVQRRWSNTLQKPFKYSGALPEDYEDPRNYDVVHTYTKTPDSGFCFYPSLTAYASSTGTTDCAAAIVGPLKLASTDGSNIKILQNELTDHGKVLIGQVDNNVAVWRADK
jgi:hypothetical protein